MNEKVTFFSFISILRLICIEQEAIHIRDIVFVVIVRNDSCHGRLVRGPSEIVVWTKERIADQGGEEPSGPWMYAYEENSIV